VYHILLEKIQTISHVIRKFDDVHEHDLRCAIAMPSRHACYVIVAKTTQYAARPSRAAPNPA